MNKTAYEKATAGEWVDSADLAKLIRSSLKKSFAGVQFRVRTAAGSIHISWVDGPPTKEVRWVASDYETAGFDGSIDLAYSYSLWLYPDGTASVAHCAGTSGSQGFVPEIIGSAQRPDGVLCTNVHSTYVFEHRELSVEARLRGYERAVQRHELPEHTVEPTEHGLRVKPDVFIGDSNSYRGTWLSCLIDQYASDILDEEWFANHKAIATH
jgi:hypothetical protein